MVKKSIDININIIIYYILGNKAGLVVFPIQIKLGLLKVTSNNEDHKSNTDFLLRDEQCDRVGFHSRHHRSGEPGVTVCLSVSFKVFVNLT